MKHSIAFALALLFSGISTTFAATTLNMTETASGSWTTASNYTENKSPCRRRHDKHHDRFTRDDLEPEQWWVQY